MGIALLTKEIKPKKFSIEMKYNIGSAYKTEGRDVRLLSSYNLPYLQHQYQLFFVLFVFVESVLRRDRMFQVSDEV